MHDFQLENVQMGRLSLCWFECHPTMAMPTKNMTSSRNYFSRNWCKDTVDRFYDCMKKVFQQKNCFVIVFPIYRSCRHQLYDILFTFDLKKIYLGFSLLPGCFEDSMYILSTFNNSLWGCANNTLDYRRRWGPSETDITWLKIIKWLRLHSGLENWESGAGASGPSTSRLLLRGRLLLDPLYLPGEKQAELLALHMAGDAPNTDAHFPPHLWRRD